MSLTVLQDAVARASAILASQTGKRQKKPAYPKTRRGKKAAAEAAKEKAAA